jgi:phytoene synthase
MVVPALARPESRMSALDASYAWCRDVARSRAKNFYYAFRLLDPARRDSLCAIYAFMRRCDDLSDEPGATVDALESWRGELNRVLSGGESSHPVWPAFRDTVERNRIPHQYFQEMIDGVSSDLTRTEITTFAELYRYCYQVASVAGLSLVHIFGYKSPEALPLAEKCGIAFQLTNILRDVGEDLRLGRVYLPREDRQRFGVTEWALSEPFLELMRFEANRARTFYQESRPLLELVEPSCRPALWALIEIYSRLLTLIEQSGFDVLRRRIRLPAIEKSWIAARALPPALVARWSSS